MKNVVLYNTTLLKGGTDKYMFELAINIDKTKFKVDVIIKNGDVVDSFLYEELKKNGVNVFLAKGSSKSRIAQLKNFFKENRNKFDIAHINATSEGTGLISYYAKKIGKVKKVVFHSHMGGIDRKKTIIDKIGKILMFRYSDVLASCSSLASEFMYGKNYNKKHDVKILKNSVNTNIFTYNEQTRSEMRKSLNLTEDDFVVLHVGRFAKQKNHAKLIDVFNELNERHQNTHLLLIGTGELLEECQQKVEELNLTDKVKFLGVKDNVQDYMQLADCFVMTSLHEGLPIVAVEAQACGLPCVLSSNISKETKLAENVEFVDLNDSSEVWVNEILKHNNKKRTSGEEVLKAHKFDHVSAIKVIEEIYES